MTDTDQTFTAEERAAMKDRSAEVKRARRGRTTPEEDARDVAAKIVTEANTAAGNGHGGNPT